LESIKDVDIEFSPQCMFWNNINHLISYTQSKDRKAK